MSDRTDEENSGRRVTRTPGPWRYEPGGGHANNSIRGSDSVQVHGWPDKRGGISNASYSDRVCENLGNNELPGPAANIRLICAAPELFDVVEALVFIAEQRWGKDDPSPLDENSPLMDAAREALRKARHG